MGGRVELAPKMAQRMEKRKVFTPTQEVPFPRVNQDNGSGWRGVIVY